MSKGEREFSKEVEWFIRMEGALSWRIVPPDLWSPYRPVVSERVLAELAYHKEALMSAFEVKCFCDGYEVLRVKNLKMPLLVTEHPCLTGIKYEELKRYWEFEGINIQIDEEISNIQKALREQLDKRDLKDPNGDRKIKKRQKETRKPSTSIAARIVRR